ncbi:SpoIIE family protein phosphatase [Prevotella sp. E13-17]|uniref:SpoIIE family protein phosphatase n=1 Tax=Prevotella sp. E13-17 TaxID=2913616 RepID=UPI001EDC3F68|nr:SpoIIE family protein phosphatase [Prevotella sp. E13-17]UKK50748.1 SpoIIE family protein phosphatase [Prevotella sp. E13-17]
MEKIIGYIRRKLSVRVSLWVVMFAALIFITALGFLFYQSREAIRQEAINRATQILDKTSIRVESIMNRVEVASKMTEWLVQRHPDKADSMFVYSRAMLLNNPDFYNCSIAFEPDYFEDYGRYFSAYSRRSGTNQNDGIRTSQGGSDNYQYFYMDWYLMAKLFKHGCWTEPYVDVDMSTNTGEMVSSYCHPIMDGNANVIGVINTSLSLRWLSQTISAVKPYPNSYSIMIGRGGTYFVHPDSTKITRQTIFTKTLQEPDTALAALGHAMQRGEEGMKQMKIDGKDCFVFYEPLADTGWSMAIVCPESDIFGGFNRVRHAVMGIVVVGLLLMLYIFIHVITRELSPLRRLAYEAENIASGQFDNQLPDFQRTDEIGQLTQSFAGMQKSLVKYIDELKNTTAQKTSIERDLHIASAIQMGMLPKNFPTKDDRDDVQIYASLTPAKDVGGDLFDFYIRDEKLFFCIGDVSGKGIPASLVMAVTRSIFRTVSARESMPDRIVTNMNEIIADMNETNMFVTIFVGVLDLPTGRMRYCNAGHDAPLLAGAGLGVLTCDANIPIGVMSDWKYSLQETQIFTGTTIFLFTDGLTEAENANHDLFRMERVNKVAAEALAHQQHEPKQLIDMMTNAVHQFVDKAEQSDDLTMMAIQYTKLERDVGFSKRIVLPNDIQEVSKLTAFVDEVCEVVGFSPAVTMQMNLALEEAVVNVMNYAYPEGTHGDVTIEAKTNDVRLKFTIIDSGTPFDPTAMEDVDIHQDAEDRPIGGLGIHLVRQIMDSVNYERVDNLNVLTLRKKLRKNN